MVTSINTYYSCEDYGDHHLGLFISLIIPVESHDVIGVDSPHQRRIWYSYWIGSTSRSSKIFSACNVCKEHVGLTENSAAYETYSLETVQDRNILEDLWGGSN